MTKKRADKNRKVTEVLKKSGLKEIPKDKKSGKLVTSEIASSFAQRKAVRRCFRENQIFYCCPGCGKNLENKRKIHKNLCMKCGQYLDWSECENMHVVYIRVDNEEDAGYWASEYETSLTGGPFTISFDIEKWRLERKSYPLYLYCAFPDGKGYGRFMRKAAKEARIITDIFSEEVNSG